MSATSIIIVGYVIMQNSATFFCSYACSRLGNW